jgi:shikimate kinase
MNLNKISLIGMPSAGKTSVAKVLAFKLGYEMYDLDSMVEKQEQRSLIEILEKEGAEYFLNIEYSFLEQLPPERKVIISTAGSIIYHDKAMDWLKANSTICFIDTELSVIEDRLAIKPKAVVGLKEKGLQMLWNERIPVYKKWADIHTCTGNFSIEEIVDDVILKLNS